MTESVFIEKQRFTQWWAWLLLIAIHAGLIYSLVSQMVFGIPVGDNPMPTGSLLFTWLLVLFLSFLVFLSNLRTEISETGITVKFFPFHFWPKEYKWSNLEKVYVRQYKPLREYGGWGLRLGLFGKGLAYNIKGNMGLQLVFSDGSRILIGTQKPGQIEEVLKNLGQYRD